jgi:hypothetical protein
MLPHRDRIDHCEDRHYVLWSLAQLVWAAGHAGEEGIKSLIVIAALAVAAPNLALAQGNSGNTPASQNSNGLPFTANDPPLSSFQGQGPPSLPPGLGGSFPPGCAVLALDKDDRNGLNGDDKKPVPAIPIVSLLVRKRRSRRSPRLQR